MKIIKCILVNITVVIICISMIFVYSTADFDILSEKKALKEQLQKEFTVSKENLYNNKADSTESIESELAEGQKLKDLGAQIGKLKEDINSIEGPSKEDLLNKIRAYVVAIGDVVNSSIEKDSSKMIKANHEKELLKQLMNDLINDKINTKEADEKLTRIENGDI